jgi:predicted nucleotidyltransferase
MAVDPEETLAHVQAVLERRRSALEERASHARRIARVLASSLINEHGARRVLLHGSLASGHFHERSDIDLAVEGLSAVALMDAGVALDEAASPFNLDLVSLERMPEGMKRRIEQQGILLP